MTQAELESQFEDATALRDVGDLSGAKQVLERLAREHPEAFPVWLVLGGIEMKLKDYEAAEKAFATATALKPRSESASVGLFLALARLRRDPDAFAEMRRFLALRPESHEYELIRAEMDEKGYY